MPCNFSKGAGVEIIYRKLLQVRSCIIVAGVLVGGLFSSWVSAQNGLPGYLVGPEDILEISVWREESLQREVLVRPDGRISFPLVGDLQVAGSTPGEIQSKLSARLKKFIPDPVVTVVVTKVGGYKIYIIGQVKQSGQYAVGRYLDVVQALALAGGLTPY
ncbi:MAG TPA: polysaccharide export protein, partial [Gammaproteobacteria bacterium]|nr:polysaccharide export protein [Gammaproteobacteria bacterium]